MNMPSSSIKNSSYGPPTVDQDLLVLNVDSWPVKDSALIAFGNTNIKRLVTWFDPVPRAAGCQFQDVINQWHSLKISVNAHFYNKAYCSLWRMLLFKDPYKTDLTDTFHLVEILLVLRAISAVCCERIFSAQNRIKSSLWASLKTPTLKRLILILAQDPSLEDFDPQGIWVCFRTHSQRLRNKRTNQYRSW